MRMKLKYPGDSSKWSGDTVPGDVILRRPQVQKKTGLGRSAIYARMKARQFPRQVSLGGRSVGWLLADIDAWIAAAVAQRGDE